MESEIIIFSASQKARQCVTTQGNLQIEIEVRVPVLFGLRSVGWV